MLCTFDGVEVPVVVLVACAFIWAWLSAMLAAMGAPGDNAAGEGVVSVLMAAFLIVLTLSIVLGLRVLYEALW